MARSEQTTSSDAIPQGEPRIPRQKGSKMHIDLPYPPSANRYVRHAKGRHFRSAATEAYRTHVIAAIFGQYRRPPKLKGRLAVEIDLTMPDRKRRDIDNTLKVLLDALENAGAYENDEQIDLLTVRRCGVRKPGATSVTIKELKS